MNKITLTEMPNTAVECVSQEEYEELMQIYKDAGWKWVDGDSPNEYWGWHGRGSGYNITDGFVYYTNIKYAKSEGLQIISLDRFKKLQGIGANMSEYQVPEPKYKVGDILINQSGGRKKVLGVCGEVYFLSRIDNYKEAHDYIFTASELDFYNYKLDTEKPKIRKTKKEIAEKFGINVDELEIVEG